MKTNAVQANPELQKTIHAQLARIKDEQIKNLAQAYQKTGESQNKSKKNVNKKMDYVRLSNTDSIDRCVRIKARLNAKMSEIYASELEVDLKNALARNIILELNKVDQKIAEIRRRETAMQEEKVKKTDDAREKRRRQHDIQKKTVLIRKDYLYPADEGGFDPNSLKLPAPAVFDMPAVAYDIGDLSGTLETGGAAPDTTADVLM